MTISYSTQFSVPPTERTEDLWLAQSAGRGNPEAQAALVDRLMDQVRRTASYLAGQSEEAEDLAQSALIRILRSAQNYRGECSLEYWAERITVHTSAKWLEKKKRRRGIWDRTYLPDPVVASVEEEIETYRARCRLAAHLSTLGQEVRVTMVLHYLNGRSIHEVADLTDVPVNTVRGRLRIGRKRLRKKILNDPLLRVWVREMYK
jgi:RNA polymerase sigma-70 factor, ECF subfamily